jgi:SEC-C motif-containing protein
MRSRYAAFALGLGGYVNATLARTHPPQPVARGRERYLDLCIMHTAIEGDRGEVLFHAKIFEKGADRSFAELSSFVREEGAWKYESGILLPSARLPADPKALTLDAFLKLASE